MKMINFLGFRHIEALYLIFQQKHEVWERGPWSIHGNHGCGHDSFLISKAGQQQGLQCAWL